MSGRWQVQEAKQRFSELIRSVQTDGPQFVTKHGEEVAVVIDIAEYRRLRAGREDAANFKYFLSDAPDLEVLVDIHRPAEPARPVELGAEE